jgi:YD repeat-containing protein
MKNRSLLIFISLVISSTYSTAQTSVEYTYDLAGNRVQRNVLIVGGKSQQSGGSETTFVSEKLALENEGDIFINLYPNPTQADVTIAIDYQDVPQQEVTMSLYDASGKMLESKQVNSTHHQISLEQYPTGIYYLRMTSRENRTMKEVKIFKE